MAPRKQGTTSLPAAFSTKLARSTPGVPRVIHGKDIILANVTGSATPNFQEIDLNPRLDTSFPSASLSAQRYDMYEFTSLRFRYFPTSASTTTTGIVFLGWEPNANRQAPPNSSEGVQIINAFEYHTQGPLWSPNVQLNVDQRHLPPPRYCRHLPTGSDMNIYDTGSLIVGTDGGPGTTVGYVEVEYSIRFYNYHLTDNNVSQSRAAYATLEIVTPGATAKLTPTFTEKFGNDQYDFVTGSEWTIPAGKYLLATMICADPSSFGTYADFQVTKNGSPVLITGAGDISAKTQFSLTGMIESNGSDIFEIGFNCSVNGVSQVHEGSLSLLPLQ